MDRDILLELKRLARETGVPLDILKSDYANLRKQMRRLFLAHFDALMNPQEPPEERIH